MESVILSGPSDVKIKRKYVLPSGYQENLDTLNDPFFPTDPFPLQEDDQEESDPYFIWRRNTPFVYDSVSVYNLDWPSLVVDFMDDSSNFRVKNGSLTQRLLLGTHTSGAETEFAMVAELRTPVYSLRENMTNCENFNGFLAARKNKDNNTLQPNFPNLDIKAKIVHPGEVNRISHVPKTHFSFLTQSNNGTLYLFDYSKHPSNPRDTKTSHPQLVFSNGHSSEGYGISWNSSKKLASCASDGTLCLWDLNCKSHTSTKDFPGVADNVTVITPLSTYAKNPNFNFLSLSLNRKKEQVKVESDPNNNKNQEDDSTVDNNLNEDRNNTNRDLNQYHNNDNQVTNKSLNNNYNNEGLNQCQNNNNNNNSNNNNHNNNNSNNNNNNNNTEGLNDVEFLHNDDNTVVTCCDDGGVYLVDFRTPPNFSPGLNGSSTLNGSSGTYNSTGNSNSFSTSGSGSSLSAFNNKVASLDTEVNCLSVNPFDSNYFICGCSNGNICLFDLRVPGKTLLLLDHHKDSVTQIEFNRSSCGLFASSSNDSTVCIFDLACRGNELRFVHQGHKAQVNDISWAKLNHYQSAHVGFTLASVSQDNLLQCFTPNYFAL